MKYAISIFFSFFLSIGTYAQQAFFLTEEEGELYTLEERMDRHKVNGASLTIIRNFELDTTIQLGYRDREDNLLVNEETLFQMGSMTGAIVKFATIRLVSDGKIKLDTPVNDYLKTWKIEEKGFTKNAPITVRDLLLERRGFNPIYKPKGYVAGAEIPTVEQILNGEKPSNLPALALEKNKSKKSSLANDLILQKLLEDVHGKDFPTLIQEQVFEPLGMNNSIITSELTSAQKQNACVGYNDNQSRIAGDRQVYPELAHSGLWSTSTDYAKFVLHIFKAAKGLDNSLLRRDLAILGVKAQHENETLILLEKLEGGRNYWGGATKGFYCQFEANLEEGWIVVGCSNRQLAWQFVNWDLNSRGIEYARRSK
ncbi:MAG: serine hydrolase domain-containing protein [Bacteroidota bacterium]